MSIDRVIRTAGILGFLVPFGLLGGSAAFGVSWYSLPYVFALYVFALWPTCIMMLAPTSGGWTRIAWFIFSAFLNASYYVLVAIIVHGILQWLNNHFRASRQKAPRS